MTHQLVNGLRISEVIKWQDNMTLKLVLGK